MGLLSVEEFAFFPLAFFGGTFTTRLMAGLLLAQVNEVPSGLRLVSVNLKIKACIRFNQITE